MTIEEKAQAYDEALEKAKIEINTKGIGETVNLCEQLFPELRESEDERIRKFLIQHISEWIGCIEHDLKYSSKDIESEKELAMFKAGLAYLEKQKKCVAGSSKTSADEAERIIEGFKGLLRGIKEKGGLTLNMVSIEKCEAWLEKQKEQNGEDELLEDELSAFLQNYDKEYDDDAAVSDVARHFYEIGKKQNEQKPNYCLYGGDPNVGRCRWCYAACNARLADVHTDEEKEYVRTIKSIISDFIRDKKPENLAYYQRIYDWLDGRHVPSSCGHENGEPADPEAMKRNKQFDELLARVPEETKRRVDRQLSCKWLRNGNECGKGLPGTPCEIVGCVAWQHYKED